MKRSLVICALWCIAAGGVVPVGIAQVSATHRGGHVEAGIAGKGSLASRVQGNLVSPNFTYPTTSPDARDYLQSYSEVWVGTATAPVASSTELSAEGRLGTGEWVTASFGDPRDASRIPGQQRIDTAYRAKLSDTFDVLVEQSSFTWSDPKSPESHGVIVRLTMTNLGELAAENVYVALATNWDMDAEIAQAGNPNLDFVQWDAARRASITYDGDPSDGTNPIQAATVLIEGKIQAHRIALVPQTPWTFTDEQRAGFLGAATQQTQTAVPQNYFTIVVAGPFALRGKNAVTAVFALVAGEGRDALLAHIDGIRQAAARPARLATEAVEGGVRLSWSPPVLRDVSGYAVFRSTSKTGAFQQIGSRIVASTEYVDSTAAAGTTYYYRVQSVNSAEQVIEGATEVVAGATGPKPGIIAGITASLGGEPAAPVVKLALDLGGVDGAKALLYRNETGSDPWTLIQTADMGMELTDAEVSPGKRYFYAVRIGSDVGRLGDLSPVADVTIPASAASVASDLSRVVAAPNPVRAGQAVRFMNLPTRATVSIYTPSGERIARLDSLGAAEIAWTPDASIASGVYVYQVQWAAEAIPDADDPFNVGPSRTELQNAYGKIAILR